MHSFLTRGFVMFAGLLTAPLPSANAIETLHQGNTLKKADPRLTLLRTFFERNRCPLRELAHEFIRAADENRLDWRLLPSISLVESGGGRKYQNNNVFGWANGSSRFPSVRASIHTIAQHLHHSHLYRNKNVDGILGTYNTRREYQVRVKNVMRLISPDELILTPN